MRGPNSRGNVGGADIEAVLAGHCRQAVTLLPRGVLGVATAIEFLGALPRACRLGLPTSPSAAGTTRGLGMAASTPWATSSANNFGPEPVTSAGVSPLLQARSARQWTLWLGQVREPGSTITAAAVRG